MSTNRHALDLARAEEMRAAQHRAALTNAYNQGFYEARSRTWPAALAADLERAARHLWANPTNGQALYNVAEVLEAVDQARARGEIPARREAT